MCKKDAKLDPERTVGVDTEERRQVLRRKVVEQRAALAAALGVYKILQEDLEAAEKRVNIAEETLQRTQSELLSLGA